MFSKDEYIKQAYAEKKGNLLPIGPNGTLRMLPLAKDFTGTWRMWYENGNLAAELEYRSGVLHGRSLWWNEDGSKFGAARFQDGKASRIPWPDDRPRGVQPSAPKPIDETRTWEIYAAYYYFSLNFSLNGELTRVFQALGDASEMHQYFNKDSHPKKYEAYRQFIVKAFTEPVPGPKGNVAAAMFIHAVIDITPPDVLLSVLAPEIGPKGKLYGLLNGKNNAITKHIQRQQQQGHIGPPDFGEYVRYIKGMKSTGFSTQPNADIIVNHMLITDPQRAFVSMLSADYGFNPHIQKNCYQHCKKDTAKEVRRLQQETADINDYVFRKRYSFSLRDGQDVAVAVHLKRLASHEKWWVRLYVASLVTNHLYLREPELMKVLNKDTNEYVQSAMKLLAKEKP